MIKLIWAFYLIFLFVFCSGNANALELSQRLTNWKQWEKLTSVQPAVGDLIYPEWMKGEWEVKSQMVDLIAPLAPDIVTPGFESNRQYLNQPISFKVKFVNQIPVTVSEVKNRVIADRAYNGLNLARAILGNDTVKAVKVDPDSPNRQITFLRGECAEEIVCDTQSVMPSAYRQLISIVKSRATETTADGRFIATELFQQLFKGGYRPYLNSVESTTAYTKLSSSTSNPAIEANQVTAVYLSSQDPDYFKAVNKPVALYRYRLQFFPIIKQ